jgi:hypothetical protein
MALDYAGFIPGEGVAHALLGIGLGLVSTPISAAHGDVPGALGGIAGIQLSALEMIGSKAISRANYGLNIIQTVKDYKDIPEAYKECMGGG